MTLSIECSILPTFGWSGIHFYAYHVLNEMTLLAPDLPFVLHFDTLESNAKLDAILLRENVSRHNRTGRLRYAAMTPLDLLSRKSSFYYSFTTARLRSWLPCPAGFIIHDCGWILHPEFYDAELAARQKRTMFRAVRKANLLFTVSESVKKEVVALFDFEAERVIVAPNAAVPREVTPRKPDGFVDAPFFLMVNPGRPNKNWVNALEGFAIFVSRNPKLSTRLVLAGDPRKEKTKIRQKMRDLGLESRVICTGYLHDQELEYLYRSAELLLFPSWYEGFGIPILEAYSHDLPLVLSDIPVFREVAGEAGFFIDPARPDAIAHACETLILNEGIRQNHIDAGRKRLRHYSWRASAQRTLDAIRSQF